MDIRRLPWLRLFAGYTTLSLAWSALWLFANQAPLTMVTALNAVAPEVLFWLGWAVLTPFVWREAGRRWTHHLVLAPLAAFAAYGIGMGAQSVLYIVADALGAPLVGTLPEQLGRRVAAMLSLGVPLGCIVYALIVAVARSVDAVRQLGAERERSARLEAALSQAELQALKMQLRPHFLFNALNTISSTLQTDPDAADRMLSRLADFLRLTLDHDHRATVSLNDELAFSRQYLQIEQDRLEDRLAVHVEVAPKAREAAVPYLVLQPLVENAIRHGVGRWVGAGTVTIRAGRDGDDLILDVENTGPPLAVGGDGAVTQVGTGIGLSNTRSRLRQVYGDRASLDLTDTPSGVRARIRLPFELYREPEVISV